MVNRRNHFTAEEKVTILRRHLLEKVPVSDLCEELNLQPTGFYRWQRQLFENGVVAFEREGKKDRQRRERTLAAMERKLQKKDEVLASLMEEHVALKKTLGQD